MQGVTYHDPKSSTTRFIPKGAPSGTKSPSAVTVKAGDTWLSVYQALSPFNQMVVGGGCVTVGAVGGFTLGGGLSDFFTKGYGTAAANLLQAQVVTADGQLLTVNKYQHLDLFWALRGGGGHGVVTQMTYRTYPMPSTITFLEGSITAKNDTAYQALIKQLLITINNHMLDGHWGTKFTLNPNDSITFNGLSIVGLTQDKATKIFNDSALMQLVKAHPELYTSTAKFTPAMPTGLLLGSYNFNVSKMKMGIPNPLPGYPKNQWWRASQFVENGGYQADYHSWFVPASLLQGNSIQHTTDTLYAAAKIIPVTFSLGKVTGGKGPQLARDLTAETATNPTINQAGMLLINGLITYRDFEGNLLFPSVIPLTGAQKQEFEAVNQKSNTAFQTIKALAPNAGTYVNESDYHEKNWQTDYWGTNYPRLLAIKKHYDPTGVFYVHHGVGSEFWAEGGMVPIASKK